MYKKILVLMLRSNYSKILKIVVGFKYYEREAYHNKRTSGRHPSLVGKDGKDGHSAYAG
jgi:hypothetical protein